MYSHYSGVSAHNWAPFRLLPKEKTKIEQQVKTALDNGWIEQSSSAYGAPVLFVPKPDGSLRMGEQTAVFDLDDFVSSSTKSIHLQPMY